MSATTVETTEVNPIVQLLTLCRLSDQADSVSDIHIVANEFPWIRCDGEVMEATEVGKIDETQVKAFVDEALVSNHLREILDRDKYVSTSLHSKDFGSVRVHVMRTGSGLDLVIRLLNAKVPELKTLALPNIIESFADTPNGLYLFTGATGMGKSTALAALVNEINKKYPRTIFTVEDPVEYKHQSKKSLVRQLTVGQDVKNYAEAIRSFLRADPDVILIGEMRDPETMEAALRAAETGHLVFSTVHDNGVEATCQRIVGSFEGDRQAQIKMSFASVMRGVVSLRLMPRANGEGRVAAAEIMVNNDAIRTHIMEGKFHLIRQTMQQNGNAGMQTLEEDLNRLVKATDIDFETACEYANHRDEIKK